MIVENLVTNPGVEAGSGAATVRPTSVSLAGARLTMDVDGRQISAVIRDQIVEADRSGRVTIENGKKRYI